jgi:PKD repeat protein
MKKVSFLTLLLALCFGYIQAQSYTLTLSGQVTDINGGAPIPYYPVDVVLDSTNFFGFYYFNNVTTDINGYYRDTVTIPGGVPSGTGRTSVRDCTPGGYLSNSFSYMTSTGAISNLDFAICPNLSIGCQSSFSPQWVLGTTIVNFTDYSSSTAGTINAWAWDFGDGNSSSAQNPSHTYGSLGTYQVCLTTTTTTGCSSTFCDTLLLGSTGVSCWATIMHTINPNGSVSYTANASGTGSVTNYLFDFGDGNTSSGSTPSVVHTYATNGYYTPCVYVDFSDSCRAVACDSVSIGSTGGCQAGFYSYADTTGQYSIIIVDQSTGNGLSYLWTFGDGSSSALPTPSHQYNGPGTYVVCVTVTSTNPACTSTYCDSITVINKINAPFTINVVSSTATAVKPTVENAASISIAPNPAHDYFQVQLGLNKASNVSVALMDLSGKIVALESAGNLGTGNHSLRLNTAELPAGLYLARVQAGESISTHKVMIAR